MRAYAQSGQQRCLTTTAQALLAAAGRTSRRSAQYAAGDPELDLLVAAPGGGGRGLARPVRRVRVRPPTAARATFDRGQFRDRRQRFDATSASAHQATTARRSTRGSGRPATRARSGSGAPCSRSSCSPSIGGLVVIAQSRRRLLAELVRPAQDLEQVVQRMAAQDHDARAADAGPQEVRAVAAALNELADAQARARAVEGRIQDELRNLDTAKDDFVSNVSHELRTPLTTISGYLELVAEEFEDRMEPRHEKMLAASRRNVSRLRLLIDDLLTLSKAEARATEMEPSRPGRRGRATSSPTSG